MKARSFAHRLEMLGIYEAGLRQHGRMTEAVSEAITLAREVLHEYDFIVYIAGALTEATDADKFRYTRTSHMIENFQQPGARMFGYAPHLHGTDPVRHPDVTPAEVCDIDYLFAAIAPDMHINFMHPVAHGNAIEAGWAMREHVPSLFMAPTGQRLSRLVRGLTNVEEIIRYDDFLPEGLEKIRAHLASIESDLVHNS